MFVSLVRYVGFHIALTHLAWTHITPLTKDDGKHASKHDDSYSSGWEKDGHKVRRDVCDRSGAGPLDLAAESMFKHTQDEDGYYQPADHDSYGWEKDGHTVRGVVDRVIRWCG